MKTILTSLLFCLAASAPIDNEPIRTVDLDRFMGRWYEIARFDHRFERHLEGVSTEYTLLDDGKIRIVNQGVDARTGAKKEAVGRGRVTSTTGLLRVAFFGFFYADYRILELSPDYSWALVGGNSDRYLWILSRTPTLPTKTLQQILHLAEQRGYDTKKLIYVDQP